LRFFAKFSFGAVGPSVLPVLLTTIATWFYGGWKSSKNCAPCDNQWQNRHQCCCIGHVGNPSASLLLQVYSFYLTMTRTSPCQTRVKAVKANRSPVVSPGTKKARRQTKDYIVTKVFMISNCPIWPTTTMYHSLRSSALSHFSRKKTDFRLARKGVQVVSE
jgi:hypothetical protein